MDPGAAGPRASFLAPDNNSLIADGAVVQIAAIAEDPTGSGVARIDFSVDDVPLGSQLTHDAKSKKSFTALQIWQANGVRGHLISAAAFRADNSAVGNAVITVIVVPYPGTGAANQPTPSDGSTPLATAALPTNAPTVPPTLPVLPTNSAVTAPPVNVPQVKVTNAFLNVRAGPDTVYRAIGVLKAGDVVTIIGRNADRSWWVIDGPNGLRGWIINNPAFIQVSGDTANVVLAAAPPSPAPSSP